MTVVRKLEKIAKKNTCQDVAEEEGEEFFNVYDVAGGNIDDAYQAGYDDGQIELAREMLALAMMDN
jgi:hypothetical protein